MQLWSSTASGKMTTFGQWCILLQKRSVGELLVLSVGRSVSFHLQVYLPWFLDKHDYLYLLSSKVLTVIVVHLLSKGRTGQKLYLIFLCRVESSSFFNFLHANFLSNFLTTMKLEKRKKYFIFLCESYIFLENVSRFTIQNFAGRFNRLLLYRQKCLLR